MSDLSIYGRIVTAPEVEQAVTAVIEERIEEYVARMERHAGRNVKSIALPKSYITKNDLDHWPEESLPSVVVTAPGLDGPPKMEGDGSYRAKWLVGVGVVVGATSTSKAIELSKLYGAAVRELLIQNSSLEGFSEGITWENEKYDDLGDQDSLNLAAASVIIGVEVRGVANRSGGTMEPPKEPYEEPGDPSTVESTQVTVKKEEL